MEKKPQVSMDDSVSEVPKQSKIPVGSHVIIDLGEQGSVAGHIITATVADRTRYSVEVFLSHTEMTSTLITVDEAVVKQVQG